MGIFVSERRILGSLFPVMRQQRLAKRDLESHEHGHDFVSADGALVTICFLTFSVFLIKLVLVRLLRDGDAQSVFNPHPIAANNLHLEEEAL